MAKVKVELQENRKKKRFYTIISIVSACVAIGAIGYLIAYKMSLNKQEDVYSDMRVTEQTGEIIVETEIETHGGANIKVMEMMEDIRTNVCDYSDEEEVAAYLTKIINKVFFMQ